MDYWRVEIQAGRLKFSHPQLSCLILSGPEIHSLKWAQASRSVDSK